MGRLNEAEDSSATFRQRSRRPILELLFFDLVARIYLLLLFFGQQFQDALTLGFVSSIFEQCRIMPDVFSSNKAVHGLSPLDGLLSPKPKIYMRVALDQSALFGSPP